MDKFRVVITCNTCGSTDCEMHTIIDYDYDENPYENGSYIVCNTCGENDL